MHGVIYGVMFWNIMCNKLDLYFTSDIENLFGSGVGWVFEVGVEEK